MDGVFSRSNRLSSSSLLKNRYNRGADSVTLAAGLVFDRNVEARLRLIDSAGNKRYYAYKFYAPPANAVAIALDGAALSVATTTGNVTTQIRPAGAAASLSTSTGGLTAQIQFNGSALAQAIAAAGLSTGIPLLGAAADIVTASATMTAGAGLSGAAQAIQTASAALTTAIRSAGNAQDQATAAGALLTAINLAGVATDQASASAYFANVEARLRLIDTAGNKRYYTKLLSQPVGAGLAGAANDSTTAGGTLSTGIRPAGNATAQATAAAGLINFSTVTLADPLYFGTGSILDSAYWDGPVPVAGQVVAFDPANGFSIASNGEISASVNTTTNLVQYYNGSTWQLGSVTILPTAFVGIARGQSTATGALAGGGSAALAGNAVDVANAAATLFAAILLQGNASAQTNASAGLATAIRLLAAATSQSTATGALNGGAQLSGGATDVSTAAGTITAQIRLAGTSVAQALAAGGMSTGILLSGAALDQVTAGASLNVTVTLSANAIAQAIATGSITVVIQLQGQAISTALAAASLSVAPGIAGNAQATATAGGNVTASIRVQGSATAIATTTATIGATSPYSTDSRYIATQRRRSFTVKPRARTFKVAA